MTICARTVALLGGCILTFGSASVVADIPGNLADIPYQSTEWGSEQLRYRGYTLMSSDWHDGRSYEYWWQASSNTCIQARSSGGKYEALKTTSGTDCGQYHKQATSNDTAAAVAVGARASSADSDMRSRGFYDTGGYKQGNKSFVTWYNRNMRQCVNVVTQEGRIKRIDSKSEGNCT